MSALEARLAAAIKTAGIAGHVNDERPGCWICGDPDDHVGIPHDAATGDTTTRYDVIQARANSLARAVVAALPTAYAAELTKANDLAASNMYRFQRAEAREKALRGKVEAVREMRDAWANNSHPALGVGLRQASADLSAVLGDA